MSWTSTFINDSATFDAGMVQATWNKGMPDEFVFSGRIESSADISTFIDNAKAAQIDFTAKQGSNDSISAKITSKLNS